MSGGWSRVACSHASASSGRSRSGAAVWIPESSGGTTVTRPWRHVGEHLRQGRQRVRPGGHAHALAALGPIGELELVVLRLEAVGRGVLRGARVARPHVPSSSSGSPMRRAPSSIRHRSRLAGGHGTASFDTGTGRYHRDDLARWSWRRVTRSSSSCDTQPSALDDVRRCPLREPWVGQPGLRGLEVAHAPRRAPARRAPGHAPGHPRWPPAVPRRQSVTTARALGTLSRSAGSSAMATRTRASRDTPSSSATSAARSAAVRGTTVAASQVLASMPASVRAFRMAVMSSSRSLDAGGHRGVSDVGAGGGRASAPR